jgi:hypothetical protein
MSLTSLTVWKVLTLSEVYAMSFEHFHALLIKTNQCNFINNINPLFKWETAINLLFDLAPVIIQLPICSLLKGFNDSAISY